MSERDKLAKIGFTLLILAILVGMVHGYYVASNVNPYKAYFSGNTLCNGRHIEDSIRVDNLDRRILVHHKIVIEMGTVSLSLFDPSGNLVYQREDSKPIFRQHSVRINDPEQFGLWRFVLECDRADIIYELSLEVENL